MGSLRRSEGGEEVATDIQPSGYHGAGGVIQGVGAMLWDGTGWVPAARATADGAAATAVPLTGVGLLNQAGTVDRERNNVHFEIAPGLESESRTTADTSSVITNYNWNKLYINLHITTNPGSGKTLQVSVIDDLHTLCTFVETTTDAALQIVPGVATSANNIHGEPATTEPKLQAQTVNSAVPGRFSIRVTPSDTSVWAYEVRYSLLV